MIHIGDNSFSENSANASEFSLFSVGPFYSMDFKIPNIKPQEALFLVIGSIIGIDTIHAQKMGQSHVTTAYSSPPEIFFNGNKISDIKINGDNQKIKILYQMPKRSFWERQSPRHPPLFQAREPPLRFAPLSAQS